MALYIMAYSKNGGQLIKEIQWYVGSPRPVEHETLFDDFGPHRCYLEIQADGDELDRIRVLFCAPGNAGTYTIPIPFGKRVVRWYGDIAATILFNL